MDWPRARAYLIAGFLILNVMLGHRLWQEQHAGEVPDVPKWDPAFQELLGELEAVGVSLAVELPWERPMLPTLRVEPADYEDCVLAGLFEMREAKVLEGKAGRLVFLPPLGVEFIPRYEAGEGLVPSEEGAREMAEEFFEEMEGMPRSVAYRGVLRGPGDTMTVQYRRLWDDIPIYPTGLSVEVGPGGVRRVEKMLGGRIQPVGSPERVLEVEAALRALAGELRAQEWVEPRALISAELAYWGEPVDEAWTAVPAYRLVLSDGQVAFVNALDGRLEVFGHPGGS